MAEIRTANIAKMVTKQAGRAKEKVRNLTLLIDWSFFLEGFK